jgi:recombination protein RecT
MSTAVTTQQNSLKALISGEQFKNAVAEVLPKHLKPERYIRVATMALTRTPSLRKCSQATFIDCLMRLSQYGLEPDGRNAHLIPFNNRREGTTDCQLIIDYKGLVAMVMRTGLVSRIHADVVYSDEEFEYNLGEVTKHIPKFRGGLRAQNKKEDVVCVYCMIENKDGSKKFEVLGFDEVENIRKGSRSGSKGPWIDHFNEMAKKSAFRRATKWVELEPEKQDAFYADDDTSQPPMRNITPNELGIEIADDDTVGGEELEVEAVEAVVEPPAPEPAKPKAAKPRKPKAKPEPAPEPPAESPEPPAEVPESDTPSQVQDESPEQPEGDSGDDPTEQAADEIVSLMSTHGVDEAAILKAVRAQCQKKGEDMPVSLAGMNPDAAQKLLAATQADPEGMAQRFSRMAG